MPKNLLFVICLAVILVSAYLVYASNDGLIPFQNFDRPGKKIELDTAINQAKYLYRIKNEEKTDFSKGPCLSNALMPGWVLDIVHDPRQPVDDLVENQCAAYVSGQAKHFVELDTTGNLVRAR